MEKGSSSYYFILALACYFSLHILLRIFISPSLDYDEAEQALLSQWLRIGYTEQPPLYTWLQYALFSLVGKNVFAVSLLKNSLLFFTYLFVFNAARHILNSDKSAILATCSLLFIPQIGWESQRDMTHTTLVVCAVAATLYLTMLLIKKPTSLRFLGLGLAIAAGILAKANYFLFLAILLSSLAALPQGRSVLFSRWFVVSLILALLLASPYLNWMWRNPDIVFASSGKFKRGLDHYYLRGISSLFTNSILFLGPFLVIAGLFFARQLAKPPAEPSGFGARFMTRYILTAFVLLLIIVLLFKVTYVKDRWLQPLLFAAPIFFFSWISPKAITRKKFQLYLATTATAACIIYGAFAFRFYGAGILDQFCRLNFPVDEMATDLKNSGFTQGLIITEDRFLAGNLRLRFPQCTVLIPDYHFEKLAPPATTAVFVWRAGPSPSIPEELSAFAISAFQLELSQFPATYFTHPWYFGKGKEASMGAVFVPLTKRQQP